MWAEDITLQTAEKDEANAEADEIPDVRVVVSDFGSCSFRGG